jgi:tetratricopeptide (TPR) repeat protein
MLSVAITGLLLYQSVQAPVGCDAALSATLTGEARRAIAERHFDAAHAKFADAIKACPGNKDLPLERANALFMARRFAEARTASQEILHADRRNSAALKIKANSEYLLGEFEQAVSTFISLLDQHPGDYEAAYMLGRIYYQETRIDQAMGQFERVVKLNPQYYKAWDNLGLCWQARGDNQRAIAHFLHAIKLVEKDHPEYDWAYANLADLLVQTGDAEAAFSAAAKAANRNPGSARNFYIGAKALEKLGKTELCLNWLQRAAALDPSYSEAQYMLSRVYYRMGQTDKAQEARSRFLELKSKEPNKRR